MRPTRLVASALALAAVAVGAVTLYALEGNEVIVLHTRAPDGTLRSTRTWVAAEGETLWVEAAHPERPFYQQLLVSPEVEIDRAGTTRRYRATPLPNPDGHRRIRLMLAE